MKEAGNPAKPGRGTNLQNKQDFPPQMRYNGGDQNTTKGDIMKYRYFEIELGKWTNFADTLSICVLGKRRPTTKEAAEFIKTDLTNLGYDYVNDIIELSEEEAHLFFDMENENTFPVFAADEENPTDPPIPRHILNEINRQTPNPNKQRAEKFLNAADIVCGECAATECESCPVRKMCDIFNQYQ